MSTPQNLPRIDLSTLRVNQALIITLLIVAFVLNSAWLVLFVCAVMGLGTIIGIPGFKPVYQYLLKPNNIVKPDVENDNSEPHRFAQGMGAVVLLLAVLALFTNNDVLVIFGWVLSWIVVALAAINLFAGFCVGCFIYYWLNKVGVRGFVKSPPPNTFPGMRPRHEV